MVTAYKSLRFLGFPRHRVGKDGSVWVKKRNGCWMKLSPYPWGSKGYPTISLWEKGRSKGFLVHRLVLLAFVGPCPEGMQCQHFPDPNPTNNQLDNLSWGTALENQQDRNLHGTGHKKTSARGEKQGCAKLKVDEVRTIRNLYATGKYTQVTLARRFGVDQERISRIVRRQAWAHVT